MAARIPIPIPTVYDNDNGGMKPEPRSPESDEERSHLSNRDTY